VTGRGREGEGWVRSAAGAPLVVFVLVVVVHSVIARSLRITRPVARNARRARSADVGIC